MVSYYNPGNMYRHHQQAATGPTPVHSWYANYHPQSQMGAVAAAAADQQLWEPQMWHHHHHVPPPPHSVFNGTATEFNDFVHAAAGGGVEHQLMPSPTVTVSAGSDMSSPGAGGGGSGMSPPPSHGHHQAQQVTRPPPARSPYEWIKKTSYQSQPNPENYENSPHNVQLSDASSHQDPIGKTRTKDKYRVVYTDHQRVELEKEFYYSRYITIRRKAELANNLGLSERQVKIWFQNRRAKERKQVKKREEFSQKDNTMPMGHMTHQPINSNNNLGQNMMPTQMM